MGEERIDVVCIDNRLGVWLAVYLGLTFAPGIVVLAILRMMADDFPRRADWKLIFAGIPGALALALGCAGVVYWTPTIIELGDGLVCRKLFRCRRFEWAQVTAMRLSLYRQYWKFQIEVAGERVVDCRVSGKEQRMIRAFAASRELPLDAPPEPKERSS